MISTPHQLADELADAIFDANPPAATILGVSDRDARLPDLSEAGDDAFRARLTDIAARADAAGGGGRGGSCDGSCDGEDAVTLAVVRAQAQVELDHLASRAVEYTVTDTLWSPVVAVLMFLPMTTISEPAHADDYLARLAGVPAMLEAVAERHRAGIAAGRRPVRRLALAAVGHLDRVLAEVDSDPLRRPQPTAEAQADPRFGDERDRLIADVVRPALGRYREVIASEVAPSGRDDDRAGVCQLPGGEEIYLRLVRAHTSTDRTPQELHRLGAEILTQLREEYAPLGARVFGSGDMAVIIDRLRTDRALRWRDGQEMLTVARMAIERAAGSAPAWFGTVPDQQCVVEPVPPAEAPGAGPAYYAPPGLDGGRPGTYFVNTHRAQERDRHTLEATTFHEAVPGHHLQLTLAQGLADLPLLRRLIPFAAYTEGWGLYAERLADEMGLYSDDVARLGMLSKDSTRAARLVVDTGLHAMGWSRQQAVDYLRMHTPMAEVDIGAEVDRYLAAPGQALAYMVGRLEIERLRAEAEATLADRFDVRAFHDTVLGSGSVPLSVLGQLVRDWAGGMRSG
jgi:uncharacterized protein (DUF885 family)